MSDPADDNDTLTPEEGRAKIAELVDRARLSMLTTMTDDGRHVSRPMALQDVEFDGDLWFCTYDDSHKARQIAAHPQVNVAFSNPKNSEWTSMSGTAEVVRRPRDPWPGAHQGARRHRGVLGRLGQQGQAGHRHGQGDPQGRPGRVPGGEQDRRALSGRLRAAGRVVCRRTLEA